MTTNQVNYVQSVANIGGLVHDNFVGAVQKWLDVMSAVTALFAQLGPGQFTLVGKTLTFAADPNYAGMAMGSNGYLPGSQYVDPIQLQTTPARIYVRRAVDNFTVARATGEGAFEDFMTRIMRQMWDAFERATIRHIHGASSGTVALVSARTSGTVFVMYKGGGRTNSFPTNYLEPGMWLALLDVSAAYAVLGVAKISTIDNSTSATTSTVTFATSIDAGASATTDDVFVFCTSTDSTDTWFVSERNNAPLGLLDIVDPDANNSSYLGQTESAYPRIKPLRQTSADWGEIEFMEFIAQIAAKSNSAVTSDTHTMTTQPGVVIELAKTLVPFTRINEKGKQLDGGWQTVRIANHDFVEDPYHLPDVLYALCMEDLHTVNLDGEPALWDGDGSQFRRLADYDGKEFFGKHYVQRFASRRNRCGALTGITNPNKHRYAPAPGTATT